MRNAAPFKIELQNDLVIISDAKMGAFDHLPPLSIACEDLTEHLMHRIKHLLLYGCKAEDKGGTRVSTF